MRQPDKRRAAIVAEMDALLAYRSSAATAQLVRLLDVLIEDTLADLEYVTPDNLARTQGALAQLRALYRAIVDPGPHAMPKA